MRFYLRALAYFREDLPLIVASLVLIGFSTLAGLLQPYLAAILIDGFWNQRQTSFGCIALFFRMTRALWALGKGI